MSAATVPLAALMLLVSTIESEAHSGNIKSVGDALFVLSIGLFRSFRILVDR
jgi:hypothetical protein